MTPEKRIAELEAENAALRAEVGKMTALREQVALLSEQVQALEARLAKDSHNSSKPPSSDGLARKTQSLRRTSGKKPGGQLGHRGQTLRLVAESDGVVEHRPAVCVGCQAPLDAEAPVVLRERRQVQDLPPLRLQITEHQALHVRCPACQAVSVGAFPAEAPSRAQYGPQLRALVVYLVEQQLVPYARVQALLRDLFGVDLAGGTLVMWVRAAATTLAPVEDAIKTALGRVPVLHSDETGVRHSRPLARAPAAGLAANPPPERGPQRRGRRKQTPARNLLERLLLGKEQVLAFLDDLTIPFDNNQAERDLRMLRCSKRCRAAFALIPAQRRSRA